MPDSHASVVSYSKARDLYRRKLVLDSHSRTRSFAARSQAGLMIVLAGRSDASWKKAADRMLYLAPMIGRSDLAAWTFTDAGGVVLRSAGLQTRGMELFALRPLDRRAASSRIRRGSIGR